MVLILVVLFLMIVLMLIVVAGFVSGMYCLILHYRLARHLELSNPDLYLRVIHPSKSRIYWRWIYSEEDNEDPKILNIKSAMRRCTLVFFIAIGAIAVSMGIMSICGFIYSILPKG